MTATALSPRERAIRLRLRDDFVHYAAKCLKIRTKAGSVDPLVLNKPQQYLHTRLEAQRQASGRVRAIILKGRQQGCSTYVGGRYYHRASHRRGVRVFILCHEAEATANLFDMVSRYHEHTPPLVRPSTSAANARELTFDRLDSGYKVGTAGTKGVGRSQTVQMFHGSEVAFWQFAETHAAGVLQAVPDMPDTEVILESTANGVGGFFHEQWQKAEAGQSEYQAIFIPWFWTPEYRKAPPAGFTLTDEEQEYASAYGLDMEQMAWRRSKVAELKDAWLFKQEYPATAAEAFQNSGHDSFIPGALVAAARKRQVEPSGPLVIGVDPAWMGDDRTSMAWRRGRRTLKIESKSGLDTMATAGWCKAVIDAEKPARMFIDVGGVGAGVVDRLMEMGYGEVVRAVNFGSAPLEPEPPEGGGPLNRRAEMWSKGKEWLQDVAGVQIPDMDSLHADITGPGYKYDSNSRVVLEKKEDMKRRGVRSPDEGDAWALTFAEPVDVANSWAKKIVYSNKGIV
ncbi:hypothetical protein E9232_004883 [Inquilinus ginsengisoli]|uniref:Terminase n=1 Tax=Inquilinus ginsengisoli TaxID=363840 RepID=A0ABU1JVL1_9PROT|nr:hypothetical protein [Inquilinus ginsengisoli]MDR6292343.1 hypothetical protein [Inquilinus ginsengisoli]